MHSLVCVSDKLHAVERNACRWLSASEASQIEERIPGWIEGLGNARGMLSTR